MQTYTPQQTAYVGRYALREIGTGKLIGEPHRRIHPRPRLYETEAAAAEAAAEIRWDCQPVLLVAFPEFLVQGWDGERVAFDDHAEAVEWVKRYLADWKQKGDWIGHVDTGRHSYYSVYNECHEGTDAQAIITTRTE